MAVEFGADLCARPFLPKPALRNGSFGRWHPFGQARRILGDPGPPRDFLRSRATWRRPPRCLAGISCETTFSPLANAGSE